MGEFREPKFISEQPQGTESLEIIKGEEDEKFINEYFERQRARINGEQKMLRERGEEAEKKGKGGWHKKTAGFLAGLTVLAAVNATPARAGGISNITGRIIERAIGAWERTEVEKERTEQERVRREAEAKREKERKEADIAREKERTEQIKARTGGDVVRTETQESERTRRVAIEHGRADVDKDKTNLPGPYGDARRDKEIKRESPPQQSDPRIQEEKGEIKHELSEEEKFRKEIMKDYQTGKPVEAKIFYKEFSPEIQRMYADEWNRLEDAYNKTGRHFRQRPDGGWDLMKR